RTGYDNVDFVCGEIENMPLPDNIADVVVSNCVLNLVPDKEKAFREIFRILKKGGHFSISDIIIEGELPSKFRDMMAVYAACIGGAVSREEYLAIVSGSGFSDIRIVASKEYHFDDEMLLQYLSAADISLLRESGAKIVSITVNAEK
ncbi:MAG: methyltransferase domain-containing protein, partial [Spirochaetota bacterium]